MSEGGRQLAFEQLAIGSALKRYTLAVPVNQREYSWRRREVTDLFQDLQNAIRIHAPEYFLGTIVTIPRKPGALEVVDGQQRLATTAILLAAMRDALKGREADKLIVEEIEGSFLTARDTTARKLVPRLTLNVTDGAFFESRILGSKPEVRRTAPSHKLIEEAMEYAKEHVRNILRGSNPKDHGDILNQWLEFIEHRALIILLKVPNDINAYKMFETLNDRGLKTSQSDLIKNYLFGEADERLHEAQQKWAALRSFLESVDEEDITMDFLRQMLISLYGHLKKDEVYSTIQSRAKGPTSSLQFLAMMEAGAADYAALLNSDHERWNRYPTSVRKAIGTMILLPVKPMRPLVLSIITTLAPKETDRALRLIVSMSVRFLIVGGLRTGTVEETLDEAAQKVSEGKITQAKGLAEFLSEITPKDPQFHDEFKIATVSQSYLARYYLRALESMAQSRPDPFFLMNDDQQVITLEHILPEKPEDKWPEFPPDLADTYCKRLGNLCLLQAKQNSDLRSSGFEVKKLVYADTPYELTSQIASVHKWTPDAINHRQSKMAELAVKTWPVKII
jgi:hypothetical protein